jgi:hypothetical protein
MPALTSEGPFRVNQSGDCEGRLGRIVGRDRYFFAGRMKLFSANLGSTPHFEEQISHFPGKGCFVFGMSVQLIS